MSNRNVTDVVSCPVCHVKIDGWGAAQYVKKMNPASYELAVTANLREVGLLFDRVGVLKTGSGAERGAAGIGTCLLGWFLDMLVLRNAVNYWYRKM